MLPPSKYDGFLVPLSELYPVFNQTGGVQGLDQKRRLGFTACAALMYGISFWPSRVSENEAMEVSAAGRLELLGVTSVPVSSQV